MKIHIDDRQKTQTIDLNEIRRKAQTVLNALESPDAELSIVIVNDQEIARLNNTYLNRSGPTNVIAFPMREGLYGDVNPHLLGDVVISMDTAVKEARISGLSAEVRFDHLLIHGILHLFGFDHEKDAEDARAMEEKEKELRNIL